ncbi:MAG: phenylalanine--tRNA ligase subunit alpha [Coriobacteriia bacterium]|nr:phenylalanine--tRNA ligase subunit alpha [Coriobacteriia bacterium]
MSIVEDLKELERGGLEAIASAPDLGALDAARVALLGKKGSLTGVLRGLGTLPAEERPAAGKAGNEVRQALETALESRRRVLEAEALQRRYSEQSVDVTLPARRRPVGHRHLISAIAEEIEDFFVGLGYRIAEGPEVELDYYNFTALNTPPDHPARGLADTFYVEDMSGVRAAVAGESDVLLRTQTSPVQIRVMEQVEPPVYVVAPGKVFRRDVPDPSHLPQFTQIEGLAVDEGVTFADLKGTLEAFCKAMFGPDRVTRFRPHFFPFTEPSAEVDVSCGICAGSGCRFCGNTGWLEIMGCGMVDPNVFGFVNVDPERHTGFAFGMGVERIAALRYDIPDLRMLVEGDMRFLRQF